MYDNYIVLSLFLSPCNKKEGNKTPVQILLLWPAKGLLLFVWFSCWKISFGLVWVLVYFANTYSMYKPCWYFSNCPEKFLIFIYLLLIETISICLLYFRTYEYLYKRVSKNTTFIFYFNHFLSYLVEIVNMFWDTPVSL